MFKLVQISFCVLLVSLSLLISSAAAQIATLNYSNNFSSGSFQASFANVNYAPKSGIPLQNIEFFYNTSTPPSNQPYIHLYASSGLPTGYVLVTVNLSRTRGGGLIFRGPSSAYTLSTFPPLSIFTGPLGSCSYPTAATARCTAQVRIVNGMLDAVITTTPAGSGGAITGITIGQ